MKLKSVNLLLTLLLAGYNLSAQHTRVFFGLGGIYNSFQDVRFSDVQFTDISIKPELGFTRISGKDYWLANASAYAFKEEFPGFDTVQISNMGYNFSAGYLRHLPAGFYLGGTWDILDFTDRDNNLLGNNSNFYSLSSDIFISGKYLLMLTDDWKFDFGLDLGIISFINTAPSFTTNFPQNVVDEGDVSFQDSGSRDPYNFQAMAVKPFWDQILLKTHIELLFKRRLSLGYDWKMRSYADNKGYPVTTAMHSLMLRFHFVSHEKKN
jgi:hypothetical protein